MVRLTRNAETFFKDLDKDLENLDDYGISTSLHDFSYSKDAFTFDNTTFSFADDPIAIGDDDDDNEPDGFGFSNVDADGDAVMGADGPEGGEPATEDFFVGDQAVGDDYAPDYASPTSPEDGDGDGQGDGEQGGTGPFVPFDPRSGPSGNFAMAETGSEGIMYDYFDQTVKRNWMGPEHWKLRKPVRKRTRDREISCLRQQLTIVFPQLLWRLKQVRNHVARRKRRSRSTSQRQSRKTRRKSRRSCSPRLQSRALYSLRPAVRPKARSGSGARAKTRTIRRSAMTRRCLTTCISRAVSW